MSKTRADWDEYHMGFARHAATASKDPTQVGAVLVQGKNTVLSTFNGPPEGVRDLPERLERPKKYLFAAHAEENIISLAAKRGIRCEGGTVYVTHAPCAPCVRMMLQAGIRKIIYGPGKTSMPHDTFEAAIEMCEEKGVQLIPLD